MSKNKKKVVNSNPFNKKRVESTKKSTKTVSSKTGKKIKNNTHITTPNSPKKKLNKLNSIKNDFPKNLFVRHKPILVFLLKFFLIFFVLELVLIRIDLTFFNNFLATIIAILMGVVFYQNQLFTSSGVFTITNSCTGLVSLAILISITLPLKKIKLIKRIYLVLIGAFFLLTLNVPRIIFIIYASTSFGVDPNFVHELTWFGMSGLILLIWFFGLKFIQRESDFSKFI